MRLSKPFLIPLVVFTSLLLTSFYLGFFLFGQKKTETNQPSEFSKNVQRPLINEADFDNTKYVVPLENNTEGSVFSSRAQVRGIISLLEESKMTVKVGEETYEIALSSFVYIKCMPETFTGPKGTVPASEVFLDFGLSTDKGKQISSSELSEFVSINSDVTVLVDVDENDKMMADMVVGYGCRLFE